MDNTESTGPISIQDINSEPGTTTEVFAPITIDDILNSVEVITKKEADDKAILESIGAMPVDTLKEKLLQWAKLGFPNVYEIQKIIITPPTKCSDGVTRNLPSYIEYCSGKPIQDHVALLQSKVSGMTISFANMNVYIAIVVSKN
jgi:hypothetical protein